MNGVNSRHGNQHVCCPVQPRSPRRARSAQKETIMARNRPNPALRLKLNGCIRAAIGGQMFP